MMIHLLFPTKVRYLVMRNAFKVALALLLLAGVVAGVSVTKNNIHDDGRSSTSRNIHDDGLKTAVHVIR